MLALGFGLLMIAAAAYMAGSARRFHVAPILWCGAWGAMLLLYRLLGSGYEYLQWVIWFTIACVLAWIAGHHVGGGLLLRGEAGGGGRSRRQYQFRWLRTCMIATFAIGMVAPANWIRTAGIDIGRITSGAGLNDVAQSTYQLFLEQRIEQDGINKICLLVALVGVLIAGLYIGLGRPIDRSVPPKPVAAGETPKPLRPTPYWLLLAPFVPYLAMMLLSTIRSLLVVPLLMMFGAWVAGRYLVGREQRIFRAGTLLRLGGALIAAIAVVIYMQAVRGGDGGLSRIGRTVSDMRVWVAGYEPALVAWMSREWDRSLHWGASTFRVIAGLFGAEDTKLVYGTGAIDIGGGTSNAMTALRFFVEDWGIYGAVAFSMLFGIAVGALGEQMRRGRLVLAPLYAMLLAAVIFAPNSWFLNYGARAFAPVLAIAYLIAFGSRVAGEGEAVGVPREGGRRRRRRAPDREVRISAGR